MKTFRKVITLIPLLILWLMLSIFLWGFVFNLITDAPAAEKLTLYVDAQTPGATQLAVQLEEKLNGKVRMVKVRPFDYAMFDSGALTGADLFIVPASHVDTYREWFSILPLEIQEKYGLSLKEGAPSGILAFDASTGRGIAACFIQYTIPGLEAEDYYLFFGSQSVHNPENENAVDSAAVDAAQGLLDMYK